MSELPLPDPRLLARIVNDCWTPEATIPAGTLLLARRHDEVAFRGLSNLWSRRLTDPALRVEIVSPFKRRRCHR